MRPTLVLNPRHDRAFEVLAQGLSIQPDASPSSLQAGLQATYPRVQVHARELSGETEAVWYVYRDGHWVGAREANDG